jgi:FkbM family methyltransferase
MTTLKYYGQFDPPLDKYLHDNFFLNTVNGVSIEAGASDGVTENNTKFFEENFQWKTFNVEPLKDWYDDLVINRPNSININCCLHPYNDNEKITFYIPYLPNYKYKNHLGSLNFKNLLQYNTQIKLTETKTITYNTIIKNHNITNLDLFTLDIEGYEIEFLKSFKDWLIYPKVFVIEIGHLDENIITEMIKEKYVLHSKLFVNNIYILRDKSLNL